MKLILLPGLDGTGALFKPLLNEISEHVDVQVIRYSNTPLSQEELVALVTEKLPSDEFVLLGESFSGHIAHQIVQKNLPNLRKVIFVASFLSNPRPKLLALSHFLPISTLLALQPPKIICKYCLLGTKIESKTLDLFLRTIKTVPAEVLAFRLHQISQLKYLQKAPKNTIEAVYIHASEDRLVSKKAINDFKHAYQHLKVHKIRASHFVLQAQPKQSAKRILQELANNPK